MVRKGKVLDVLLYLGLLACALAFCWQNVLDYLEGNTYYVTTEKKLSLGDLPTVTFCKPRFSTSNDPLTLSMCQYIQGFEKGKLIMLNY